MFRVVEAHRPTLLVDEADTFLRDNDELRGIINSGHRRGGSVLRTVGDDHQPRAFSTHSACAIALIGNLPDTLHDRSVVINLKRRLPTEEIHPFRLDQAGHLDVLARQAARWCQERAEQVRGIDPDMPSGIYNREADNWRPLLAIAEAAGGHWVERARKALEQCHAYAEDDSRLPLLLTDISATFVDKGTDRLSSSALADALAQIEGRPWAEYRRGKPITQNQLAKILKPLGIAPEVTRLDGSKVLRGYVLVQFSEAFERYVRANPTEGGFEAQQRNNPDEQRTSEPFQSVTPEDLVTVQKCEKSNDDGLCVGVTVENGGNGFARESAPGEGPDSVCAHCGDEAGLGNPIVCVTHPKGALWLHARCVDRADLDDLADQVHGHAGGAGDDDLSIPEFLLRR